MDERQLRVLRELGELGSVTAVAEALFVTPSAISQQLRLLQRSSPVPLTERRGRRVVLTAAGTVLAEAAVDVETAFARARRVVDDFTADPTTTVSLAGFHSAAAAFFPALLADGELHLSLSDQDVAQDDFAALTRDFDIVLAHRLDHSASWPGSVAVTGLLHEPLDVALPLDHRLAARTHVSPRDVAHEPWITVQDGFPLLATIESIAAAAHRPLDLVHRINDFTVGIECVAAGAGVALIPRWTVPPHPGVVRVPLRGVRAQRHIDALCRPERLSRRAVLAVLDRLRTSARTIRGH